MASSKHAENNTEVYGRAKLLKSQTEKQLDGLILLSKAFVGE